MTKTTLVRLGGVAAGAAVLGLLAAAGNAAQRPYYNNRTNNNNNKNTDEAFYKPLLDVNGMEVVPAITDEDRYARYIIAHRDQNHDHKLSRAEAGFGKTEDFDAIDTNKDGFLDLKEVKAALHKFVQGAKADAKAGNDGGDKPEPKKTKK